MNFEMFKKFNKDFLEIQKELNDKMFPKWKTELNEDNFYDAIIVETGECLDSLAYKWWKHQEKDLDNARVEIIDLLHFVLAQYLYNNESLFEEAIKIAWNEIWLNEKEVANKDTKLFLRNMLKENLKERLKNLYGAALTLGMNFEDIYKKYAVKNVLNLFRINNGYKDGSYIKEWNGKEDNVWVYQFANEIPFDENFKKNLYEKTEEFYKKNVK